MPFKQERAIALIKAALDYRQAAEHICNITKQYTSQYRNELITADEAMSLIESAHDLTRNLKNPMDTAETIAIESKHFTQNARRNASKAKKLAERRAMAVALHTYPHERPYPNQDPETGQLVDRDPLITPRTPPEITIKELNIQMTRHSGIPSSYMNRLVPTMKEVPPNHLICPYCKGLTDWTKDPTTKRSPGNRVECECGETSMFDRNLLLITFDEYWRKSRGGVDF